MFLRDIAQAPTSAIVLVEFAGIYDLTSLVVLLVLLHLFHHLEMLLLAARPCLRSFRPLLEEWYELKKLYRDVKRDYEDSAVTAVTSFRSSRRARSGHRSKQKESATPSRSQAPGTSTQIQTEAVRQARKTRKGEDGSSPLLSAAAHQEPRHKGRRIR